MASTRRLAAILALDVAGYSRPMSVDEEGTHERLKAHRRQLIDPKISQHSGRIVKTTGDGMLVEFRSVVDAVRCAAELQRAMIDREAEMPEDRRIRFRIGINLGDIIVESDDIFGDGVNVAARLEALSEPGGLCISRMVRDQIRDKLAYAFEDLGEQSIKNIARPARVYALRPATIADLPAPNIPPISPISQPAAVPRLSIVVLPFTNLGNDPEQQYWPVASRTPAIFPTGKHPQRRCRYRTTAPISSSCRWSITISATRPPPRGNAIGCCAMAATSAFATAPARAISHIGISSRCSL